MIRWIEGHTVGWQVFLPGALVFGAVAVYLQRHERSPLIPWSALATWLAMCIVIYLLRGMHRYSGIDGRRWVSMTVTLAVVTAIPIAAALIGVYLPRLKRWSWWGHAVVASSFGVAAIPLTNVVSARLFTVFAPWFLDG